ncbi:Bug family tripartite tricarboxylate transporter substrate binding protein [Ramlibacter albus]|uniref:Tripartite tricarboxylate transporter substrate binding protein n=1 Tax=Ramlibacter albus TaxID=2079448 RepID=A0A923S578_9BURK|nr:tripartite tricarboxylate transporter substrate binding protein [Ramlibacter albus]MBC5768231.1 tripartite tricarboxylate transporter substrate binding protein [Ramlibacter albus]
MPQPRLTRRHLLAAGSLTLLHLPAFAQDYPTKPVRLVIPFPAGGSSDGIGRQVAEKLGAVLKQNVVVENKGGAGGIIGADAVAKSAADGYTLVLVDVFHTSTPIYTRKMPYDAVKDFTPVSLVGRCPAFWVANPAFEAKNGADAIAYARTQPGKMTMAIAGTGSVVVDQFRARSGLKFVSVPYRGSAPAITDLIGGTVQTMITTMASAGGHVKSGKLRVLAVTGERRNAEYPDVPTFAELGIRGMDYEQWFGVMGPANLPPAVVARLSSAMEQVLAMPDVRERLAGMAMEVAVAGTAEMKRKVESDASQWVRLAQELDIKPID